MDYSSFRIHADIDLRAIRSNIKAVKKGLQKKTMTCAVIKANGYGHGAVPIAQSVADLVDFFAVATMEEALQLRQNAVTHPILILGYVAKGYNSLAIQNNLRLTVYDFAMAKQISDAAKAINQTAKIHIKADTGMSRIGFAVGKESIETIQKINKLPFVEIEGLFTHFYEADEKTPDTAYLQLQRFETFAQELENTGIAIPIKHCSNSAAAIRMADANGDMIRLGVAMYGLYPSAYVTDLPLKPALSLKSHITMVKEIEKDSIVSYGATWKAKKKTKVATIPVGYADGYFRCLSNQGFVLIHGKKAPIIGRICMDQLMADVTEIDGVKQFDEVVLIGKQKGECVTADDLAALAGTINYEIVCSISERVSRLYHS